MSDALDTRQRCHQIIRRAIENDLWLTQLALLQALERLDLAAVNEVADAIDAVASDQGYQVRRRVRELLSERFR